MLERKDAFRIVIMGAAGRDFHNFNAVYRDDPASFVVAFTAAQIPHIAGRRYPQALAGPCYPQGIPIVEETDLPALCRSERIDQVIFAYSDVSHADVMHKASIALAAGADFVLLGPDRTMLRARVPVIAVSAVRTGCGKSQVARWISRLLRKKELRVGIMRHPMPYGDLERQAVQRFASRADLDAAQCTVEEREEYEPHLAIGNVVYAGIDYAKVLALAEGQSDVILWDGGNNDFPFIRPDLHIVLVDALRPGHETTHHPGETVLRMADIVLVAKANSASAADVQRVTSGVRAIRPKVPIVEGASIVKLDDPEMVRGKRVVVVEDGPTITHGGMPYGAGYVAAANANVASIVDPHDTAVGAMADLYRRYPHIGPVLPAVGYSAQDLKSLEQAIKAAPADIVISGTPCDLGALLKSEKPIVRARYEFAEVEAGSLDEPIMSFLRSRMPLSRSR